MSPPTAFPTGATHFDPETAVAHAAAMRAAGADIIDIGGESTRPGATEVPSTRKSAAPRR